MRKVLRDLRNNDSRDGDPLRHYEPILSLLNDRLADKHEQYGASYLDRDYGWLWKRLEGELKELQGELFSVHLSGQNLITEALDVAIMGLLIADKQRRAEQCRV